MKSGKHALLASLLIIASVWEVCEGSPVTRVTQGRLSGSWVSTRGGRRIAAFRGIPYSEPPVRKLRFQSPQPAKGWRGTKIARNDGPACLQHNILLGINGEEDCLYLNVFTPNLTGKFPVLFFIHGGAFKSGSSNSFLYGPQYLLDEDIVLVTINYRLGVFGFLSLGDKNLPGNFGLKDQRLALRWVRDNIAQFGGDPDQVTIFGESAGAMSAHYHMLFNTDEGLFRAGICHSGSAYSAGAFQKPGEHRPLVDYLLSETNCQATDMSLAVDCLRKVRPMKLLRKVIEFLPSSESLFKRLELGPVLEPDCVEDALVTESPWNRTTSLPLIIGTNKYEGLFVITDLLEDRTENKFEEYNRRFEELLSYNLVLNKSAEDPVSVTKKIRKFYLQNSKIDRVHVLQLADILSDGIFNYAMVEAVKNNLNNSYLYSFNYLGSKSLLYLFGQENTYGPTHADELYLFFPFPISQLEGNRNKIEEDVRVSKQLVKMWANFVTHLEPALEEWGEAWEPATSSDLRNLHINGPDNLTMTPEFHKERMDFWSDLPFQDKPIPELTPCVQ